MVVRSEPLVLMKDGEPKNPPFTHKTWPAWKVLVVFIETNKRATKKFFSYQEAKQSAAELQEKYGEKAKVGVISRAKGYGPPYSKVSNLKLRDYNNRGLYWCPYCRQFREFHYLPYKDTRCCEFCRTRQEDFHVIKCNPFLWSPDVYRREFA